MDKFKCIRSLKEKKRSLGTKNFYTFWREGKSNPKFYNLENFTIFVNAVNMVLLQSSVNRNVPIFYDFLYFFMCFAIIEILGLECIPKFLFFFLFLNTF